MKLLIITHKALEVPKDERIIVLNVGSGEFPGAFSDKTGESISTKNSQYSEMTGIYWFWKNQYNEDFVFVVHYRRLITFNKSLSDFLSDQMFGLLNRFKRLVNPLAFNANLRYLYPKNYDLLNELDLVERKLSDSGLFLPIKVRFYNRRVKEFFSRIIPYSIFDIIESVIREKRPEMVVFFSKSINDSEMYAGNMFGMSGGNFHRYCEFIFSILFEIENVLKSKGYTLPERTMGYIAELLSNCYFQSMEKEVKTRLFRVAFYEGFVGSEIK